MLVALAEVHNCYCSWLACTCSLQPSPSAWCPCIKSPSSIFGRPGRGGLQPGRQAWVLRRGVKKRGACMHAAPCSASGAAA